MSALDGASCRVGLVGAGMIARPHASAWLATGATVTLFSPQDGAELAQRYGLSMVDTLEELFDVCDVVDVVSPSGTHVDYALKAIAHGKHVVCEKPLALNLEDAEAVAQAAARAGVELLVAHVVRFTAPYVALKRAVDRGRVGAIAVARFSRAVGAPLLDSWYADRSLSGGVIGDLLVHDLDSARWLCGEVETIYCIPHVAAEGQGRLLDGAQAVLTHVGGAVSRISATWGPLPTELRYRFSVAGVQGVIEYDSARTPGLAFALSGEESSRGRRAVALSRGNPYLEEIRHFDSVLRGDEVSRVIPADAVAAISLVDAAAESAETGQAVHPRRARGLA